MNRIIFIICLFSTLTKSSAQSFPPQVGFAGTTAIHKDNSVFIEWATSVNITLGYQNVANVSSGFANFGSENDAIGIADGTPNIVSLGDGGEAIVQFEHAITNGNGYDFAIFENGFLEQEGSELAFLELAFVEVSTDGVEYVRFPAITEIDATNQIDGFGFINARYLHNFAGKYINNYGTPFDLQDLLPLISGTTVDLNNINYIKIIDVIGTIDTNYATYDSQNNIVNDPYPTEFASGGFDLDAVGVIHNVTTNAISNNAIIPIQIYPNPTADFLYIKADFSQDFTVEVYTLNGKKLFQTKNTKQINLSKLNKGIYFVKTISKENTYKTKIVKL